MSCEIKLGLCAVFCLMISFVPDACKAECDEYIVVFEENPCPIYRLKPLKKHEINWDEVSYPCNATHRKPINKKCVIEFDYKGTTLSCLDHIKVVNHQTHSFKEDSHAMKMIESTTEPVDVPIVDIARKKKPVNEDFNTSTYDINLVYVYEDEIQNSSEITNNKTEDPILRCDYAETVCVEEGNPRDDSSDVTNKTLQISINRDTTSPVQPIFTGYFSQSSNNTDSRKYNNNFTDFKTVTLHCKLFKDKNCKQNIKNKNLKLVNIYIKTNYIQNNTVTKYPNCTKNTNNTSEKKLNLKCEDILFAKHNQHILFTPPLKQELTWTCQIAESDSLLSNREKNSKIFFKNCFNTTNLGTNKTKYEDNAVTAISDSENKTTYDVLINEGAVTDKTERPSEIFEVNKSNLPHTNPENMIVISITEKDDNCSHKTSINIHEGKIIDLSLNNDKENNLKNKNVELVITNCINVNSSFINNTQPGSKAELTIILKNESLNTSTLQQFNDTPTETSFKEIILLRCDYKNHDSGNNTTSNKTSLQCESIDLNYYNITGVEINSNLNQSTLEPKNEIVQDVLPWHCKIVEVNDTISAEEQQIEKRKLYFNNCTNDVHINNSESKSGDINVTPMSGDKPISTSDTKKAVKINKTEIPNEKIELNKDNLPHMHPQNMISILVTNKEDNCSDKSPLNIHEGKIIDLGINNNKENNLKNNNVELVLSNCINFNNSTQLQPKTELIIIFKNESLNTSNLKLFNGTLKEDNVKQRILLRCDDLKRDSSSNTISNKTLLQCESIDLNLNNITGIESDANLSQKTNANNTKEQKKDIVNIVEEISNKTKEVNAKVNLSEKVESHESTVNNKSTANNTKVVDNKEVPENISTKKEMSKTQTFNRRKDIPDGAGESNLGLGSTEPETIMLITLLTIVVASILVIIALRIFPKKKGYNVAPTREPPDNEETAF